MLLLALLAFTGSRALGQTDLLSFAMCLSGQYRSFDITAYRHLEFVRANRDVDTFAFVGWEGLKHLTEDTYHKVQSHLELWPGNTTVTQELSDPWPRLSEATNLPLSYPTDCPEKMSVLLQAHHVASCQQSIDGYVEKQRGGKPYSLIVRSRYDIRLRVPFFSLASIQVVLASIRGDSRNAQQPTQADEKERGPGILFLPNCCDFVGVNDQLAVGTTLGMKVYASRLHAYQALKKNFSQEAGDCFQVSSESLTLHALDSNQVPFYRFRVAYCIQNVDGECIDKTGFKTSRVRHAGKGLLNTSSVDGTTRPPSVGKPHRHHNRQTHFSLIKYP